MASKLYAGSTTPFDPQEWSGGDLFKTSGDGITLGRNAFWTPDTQAAARNAFTVEVPADGDIFQVKCDEFTTETNKVTVTASGTQTIDGDSTFEITSALAWSRHRYNASTNNWELIQGYAG